MMGPDSRAPWWKGSRGEWLVVIQVVLMALVFFGPRNAFGFPRWSSPSPHLFTAVGLILMALGGILFCAGIFRLGRSLTPLPYPREQAQLATTGAYGIVRHPMYGGGLILALGWALIARSWLTLGYVIVLFLFADVKSRREERWLSEKFPEYSNYKKKVRKLIAYIY